MHVYVWTQVKEWGALMNVYVWEHIQPLLQNHDIDFDETWYG